MVIRGLLKEIKQREKRLEAIDFRFVPRFVNNVAHVLEIEGRYMDSPSYWIEEASTRVEEEVDWDRIGVLG